jgi:hypothetical protein
MLPFTITPRGVSFIIEGKPQNILNNHVNYKEIVEAIKSNAIESLKELCDLKKFVAIASEGNVLIADDEVRFNNIKVNDYLAERIIYHYKNDFPIKPICNFTQRLMENPNEELREDLFKWMENGNMPICSNGNFIAYKAVRPDFTPVHKGPYGQDQSVGKTVTMPREKCDSDRNSTCSAGLHFCSWEYIPIFTDGYFNSNQIKIIILEIDPKDVVAIPVDYNLSKGRCCKFKVIGTIDNESERDEVAKKTIYEDDLDVNDAQRKIKTGRLYPVEYREFLDKKLVTPENWKFNGALYIYNETKTNSKKEELTFNHKATKQIFTASELTKLKASKNLTYKDLSLLLKIPKGTLEGWFKKIRESA